MSDPTSSGQHVLMKDQSAIEAALRRTTIVINSRDRNLIAYPNSAQFRFIFRRPLTNIKSVELISGSVPSFIYNINNGWNKFTFGEYDSGAGEEVRHTVVLTPGFYTNATLATEVQRAINALPGLFNTYTAAMNPSTGKLVVTRVTGVEPFAFFFMTGDYRDAVDPNTITVISINTPGRLLGFGVDDYFDVDGVLTGVTSMDVDNFGNRVYLHLNADNNQDLHRMEGCAGQHDAFHVFYVNRMGGDYLFLDKEKYTPIYESKPAPIARMSGIEVSFRDEFFRVVDFQGREVNLIMEITHLE